MARQDSLIKFLGQAGGMTFFKTKEGYQMRQKTGVSAARIKNDPAFARTRENMQEFSRAGRASRLLRTSLRPFLIRNADSRLTSRLTGEMFKVLKADAVNARGMRTILGPNTTVLEGFEFNNVSRLHSTLFAPYTATIDRPAGTLSVTVSAFVPQNMITPPQGATHAQLVSAGVEVVFPQQQYTVESDESAIFPLNEVPLPEVVLSQSLTPDSAEPLFLAFGIAFYQEVNGEYYPLRNGAYNPLSLVKIDGGA